MISGKYTAECNTSSEQFTTLRASINRDNACQPFSVILVKAKHQRKRKLQPRACRAVLFSHDYTHTRFFGRGGERSSNPLSTHSCNGEEQSFIPYQQDRIVVSSQRRFCNLEKSHVFKVLTSQKRDYCEDDGFQECGKSPWGKKSLLRSLL